VAGHDRCRSRRSNWPGAFLVKITTDVAIYDTNTFSFLQPLAGFIMEFHNLHKNVMARHGGGRDLMGLVYLKVKSLVLVTISVKYGDYHAHGEGCKTAQMLF
jgi:hypothetical protein